MPLPYSLPLGMGATLLGLLLLSVAPSFRRPAAAAALVGIGSSVFHPESSRVARMASGGRHGLAQSLFQVGGNGGSAAGPLLAAFIVLPCGQSSVAWFSAAAVLGIAVLIGVGGWYRRRTRPARCCPRKGRWAPGRLVAAEGRLSIAILPALIFSKYFYLASLNTLFHLLPDPEIPRFGRQRADPSVRVSRSRRHRHPGRWTAR